MTVKIIKTVRDSSTVLRIDGDLCGESVGELKRVCAGLKGSRLSRVRGASTRG